MDAHHGQFHVSALFCSEREKPLRLASTRSSLAAVAMHTHGTIIPDYLDSVRTRDAPQAAGGGALVGDTATSPPQRQPSPSPPQQPQQPQHARPLPLVHAHTAPLQHTPPPRGHQPRQPWEQEQRGAARQQVSQQVGFVPRPLSAAAQGRPEGEGSLRAAQHAAEQPQPRHAQSLLSAGLQAGLHGCAPVPGGGGGGRAVGGGGLGGGGAGLGSLGLQLRTTASSPTMIGAGTSPPLGAAEHAAACAQPQPPHPQLFDARAGCSDARLHGLSPPHAQQPGTPFARPLPTFPYHGDSGRAHQPYSGHGSPCGAASPLSPPHASSLPVAIPLQPSALRSASCAGSSAGAASPCAVVGIGGAHGGGLFGGSRADAENDRVGSWERSPAVGIPVSVGAVGRARSDAAGRIACAGHSPGGGFLPQHESPHSWTHAHEHRAMAAAHERTPPQNVPVMVDATGRGGGNGLEGDALGGLFRPVSGASSPPLFGTSPPALAMSGSPFLLPLDSSSFGAATRGGGMASAIAGPQVGASPGSSVSPHEGSLSSKMSSCRGSPFLEEHTPGCGLGGALHIGASAHGGGGRASPGAGQQYYQHQHELRLAQQRGVAGAYPSSAPAGNLRSMPASHQGGLGYSPDDLDPHSLLDGTDPHCQPLGGALHAQSGLLSRSVVSLSRDLDALRMSLNLGTAAEHADDDPPTPSSHVVSRRTSLEPSSQLAFNAQHGGAQPQRDWPRRTSATDTFDERDPAPGLIFPFAPVCNDHCGDE